MLQQILSVFMHTLMSPNLENLEIQTKDNGNMIKRIVL